MAYEKLTYKHLTRLSQKIKERLPIASGDAANNLEVRENQLLGNDYIYYLDQGRGPGKFPPVQNIAEWVKRKLGLDDKEAKQAAFAIGYVMKRDGTKIWQDKTTGIRLDDLVNEMLDELTKELPDYAAAEALKWL